MSRGTDRVTAYTYSLLASTKFFAIVLGLFVLQAVWMAFTAIYPMPFDEFAHVGAIQVYAEQWSWIVAQQPIDTGIIGDLTREPSVLYRWLMSFPYRVFSTFSNPDQTIIFMRLINVAMVAGGVVLFRKLLLEWGISRRMTHVVLLAFVVTPIVPFLAAHVNYDNLMILLTPLVLLFASRLIKDNEKLVHNTALFVLTGLAALLAKQSFAPMLSIIFVYVLVVVWNRNRKNLIEVIQKSWKRTPKNAVAAVIAIAIVLLSIMALERYVRSIVQYGTFRPGCEVVQPVEFCEQFGPWYRNNVINAENRPTEPPYGNPVSFSQYWATRMMRGYFAVFAHTPTQVVSEREPFGPIVVRPLLPLPISFAYIVGVAGLVAIVMQRRNIWENDMLRFSLVICVGYILVLWTFNYISYLSMWKAEAIQARYTYPILVLVFLIAAQAISWSVHSKYTKIAIIIAFALFYVWGGGIAGWIIRADDSWRWQSPAVQSINENVQNVLKRTVIH